MRRGFEVRSSSCCRVRSSTALLRPLPRVAGAGFRKDATGSTDEQTQSAGGRNGPWPPYRDMAGYVLGAALPASGWRLRDQPFPFGYRCCAARWWVVVDLPLPVTTEKATETSASFQAVISRPKRRAMPIKMSKPEMREKVMGNQYAASPAFRKKCHHAVARHSRNPRRGTGHQVNTRTIGPCSTIIVLRSR